MDIIDYGTLRLIWWGVLGFTLIAFAILDGFDLGIAILLPFIGKTDKERRLMLNSVGPVWEGNQVWLIIAIGVAFAAWPFLYSVAFSGFYFVLLIILYSLILRPVGFDYRHKIDSNKWRNMWDKALFISGFIPSIVFGMAIGNLFLGMPFKFDSFMRGSFTGGFWHYVNPYSILCGAISFLVILTQGSAYTAMKNTEILGERSRRVALISIVFLLVAVIACYKWTAQLDGLVIKEFGGINQPSNPLAKVVAVEKGGWMQNYDRYPLMIWVPVIVYASLFVTFISMLLRKYCLGFFSNSITIAALMINEGLLLFPFLLPSSIDPRSSLTIWDASSGHFTLFVMLIGAIILMPIMIAYSSWAYRVFKGKITEKYLEENSSSLY